MRKYVAGAAVVVFSAVGLLLVTTGTGAAAGHAQKFVVVYAQGASTSTARAAIAAAGGTVLKENTDIGVATVTTTNAGFAAKANAARSIDGVAPNMVIGRVPDQRGAAGTVFKKLDPADADLTAGPRGASHHHPSPPGGGRQEPLAAAQWDMQQIGATADGSSATSRAGAFGSASSTRASTAAIPTSPRTSTGR